MTVSQFLLILRSRWRSAVVVFAGVFGLGLAIMLWLPRHYTAIGSVVLDVKWPDPIAGVVLSDTAVPGYIATRRLPLSVFSGALPPPNAISLLLKHSLGLRDYGALRNCLGAGS